MNKINQFCLSFNVELLWPDTDLSNKTTFSSFGHLEVPQKAHDPFRNCARPIRQFAQEFNLQLSKTQF